MDADIFKELKVGCRHAWGKKSLRERSKNLKILYWDLLFKKYDKLTQRLTTKGRDRVIKRLKRQHRLLISPLTTSIFQLTYVDDKTFKHPV